VFTVTGVVFNDGCTSMTNPYFEIVTNPAGVIWPHAGMIGSVPGTYIPVGGYDVENFQVQAVGAGPVSIDFWVDYLVETNHTQQYSERSSITIRILSP